MMRTRDATWPSTSVICCCHVHFCVITYQIWTWLHHMQCCLYLLYVRARFMEKHLWVRLWQGYVIVFLYWFISYYCFLPLYYMFVESLKVNIYCEKNAEWIYNHLYRLGQIFTNILKLLEWCEVFQKSMALFYVIGHDGYFVLIPDGLLIEYLWRFITLDAVAYGLLIEYLWRVQSSRRSCNDGFKAVCNYYICTLL